MKKKIIVIICATLAMAFTLCACQDAGISMPQTDMNAAVTETVTNDETTVDPSGTTEEPTPEPTPEPIPEPTPEPIPEPTPEPIPEPIPVISAPFVNDTNYVNATIGGVSIMPKRVYWENGNLVAVCFVCNGTNNIVSNINVEALSFTGNTGLLASAAFGICNGLSLAPMTYQEWTFTFGADCVEQFGADLSYLHTENSVSFTY